jgi:hypothetical protein
MSKRKVVKRERQIRVRGIRKDPPDLRKLAGAIIALAQAQAEADAEAEAKAKHKPNLNDQLVDEQNEPGDAA